MSPTAADLLAAIKKLPLGEQFELAEDLWEELSPHLSEIDRMTDEEFEAELNRRREEAMRDPSVMIPWEEVLRQSLEELDKE